MHTHAGWLEALRGPRGENRVEQAWDVPAYLLEGCWTIALAGGPSESVSSSCESTAFLSFSWPLFETLLNNLPWAQLGTECNSGDTIGTQGPAPDNSALWDHLRTDLQLLMSER